MESTAPSRRHAPPRARTVREHVARLLLIAAGLCLVYGVASEVMPQARPPVDALSQVLDANGARSSGAAQSGVAASSQSTGDATLATLQVLVVLGAAAGAISLTWRAVRPSRERG